MVDSVIDLPSMGSVPHRAEHSVPEPLPAAAPEDAAPMLTDPQFADLLTGSGCIIPQTELRAISLDQLQKIIDHITRRLTENQEIWHDDIYENGDWKSRVVLTDPQLVNLYHTNAMVIKPATARQEISMTISLVEAMSAGPQPPTYFVSHWWGLPCHHMLACLSQMALDRGLQDEESKDYLGGRVPCFWICAYANNQHKLDEEIGTGNSLAETSFCLAMNLALGTISVVDANGVS